MSRPPVQLRLAVATDLEAIRALECATDTAPHWPPAVYAAILESHTPERCIIVAQAEEVLKGFAVGLIHPAELGTVSRTAELESVVVAADARRTGIGIALCNAVLDWSRSEGATEVVLEVRAASGAAIALYAGLGFTQSGRRTRYYREPSDDALIMRLQLGP